MLVIGYVPIAILIKDPLLTRRVNKWYEKHGWQEELKRGQKVAEYLATFNPDTPEKKRAAFIACMNIALNTTISLE
jgi:hypothetical protein